MLATCSGLETTWFPGITFFWLLKRIFGYNESLFSTSAEFSGAFLGVVVFFLPPIDILMNKSD